MNRRTYLKTAGGLAAAATIPLAGCSTAVTNVPRPSFPESKLEEGGWELIDQRRKTLFERRVAGTTIEAKAHAVAYEDVALRDEFADALGEIGHPLSAIAATRVEFSADLGRVLDLDAGVAKRAERIARERFESRLASMGVRNLERTRAGEVAVETGETATLFHYVADLSLGSMTVTSAGGESTSIDLDAVPVVADLLTWRHDGALMLAGGVYPAADVVSTIEESLAEAGIEDELGIEFDASAHRDEVRELLTAVE